MIDLSRLQVQIWSIGRLKGYDRNPRTHTEDQITSLAASMTEFGWTQPILTGSDGVIIAGHARLAAAKKLGMPV